MTTITIRMKDGSVRVIRPVHFDGNTKGLVDAITGSTDGNRRYLTVNVEGGGMTDLSIRLAALCRRLRFESARSIGILWLIERIPGLRIKEPYRTLYNRERRAQ